MRPIAVWVAMALVMCGCGRNLDRIAPSAGRVQGVEYRVTDFVVRDTTWGEMQVVLRNANEYPVDLYLVEAQQGARRLPVHQQTFVSVAGFPLHLRLAPGEQAMQTYFVRSLGTEPMRLTGMFVFPLTSMDAPSTLQLARDRIHATR